MKQLAGLYTFREITDENGLLAAFRLRYQTYANHPNLRYLITENNASLEIDGFDAYARHYGVFKSASKTHPEKMIGYIRVIWQEKQPLMESVSETIVHKTQTALPDRPSRLYTEQQSFGINGKAIQKSLSEFNSASICEPGRFILLPAYRSAGLAQFVIESIMTALCASCSHPVGIIYCRRYHQAMYERNGFTWLAKEENPDIPSNPWNLMMISREGVAQNLPNLEERINCYLQEGCINHQLGRIDWVALAYLPMMLRRWGRKAKAGVASVFLRWGRLIELAYANPAYKY